MNFPERVAARMVKEGILRLDPDGSVWRVRHYSRNGDGTSYPVPNPKRIDYPTKRGNRYFEIQIAPGKTSKVQLSRLIWQLHNGDIPPGLTVNHKDGDPTHNVIDNFELATHSEQHKHRYQVLGQESPGRVNRQLANRMAEAIRKTLKTGDLEPIRLALEVYDARPYGPMAKYGRNAIDHREVEAFRKWNPDTGPPKQSPWPRR